MFKNINNEYVILLVLGILGSYMYFQNDVVEGLKNKKSGIN